MPDDVDVVLRPGPWTHRQIAANGARFHVAEVGSGPLVLLVHGFPLHWWTWRHQLVALADAGYRVAALDLRGYGGSDKTPRGYDPVTLTGDVTGVIRSLGAESATVVGHGWGGLLAWTSAAFEPQVVDRLVVIAAAHPRRMRAAIATNPRQALAATHVLGFQRPWLPERRLTANDGAEVARLLHAWSGRTQWPSADTAAQFRRVMSLDAVAHCSLEYYRWAFRSLFRPDGVRYARRMRVHIEAPVLQIHGARDPVVLPATAATSRRQVAGDYRWELLPDVGHFPHEEDPDAVTHLLLDWLPRR